MVNTTLQYPTSNLFGRGCEAGSGSLVAGYGYTRDQAPVGAYIDLGRRLSP